MLIRNKPLLFLLVLLSLSALTVAASPERGIWERIAHMFSRRQATGPCGDGICSSTANETCSSCAQDCCPNDQCPNAIELVSDQEGKVYSLDGATNSSSLRISSACYNPNPSLWFFFRARENGYLNVSTCNNRTTADTTLSLFALSASNATNSTSGNDTTPLLCTQSNLVQLVCKDDDLQGCTTNPLTTTVRQKVVEGFTYLIQVSSFNLVSSFGYFEIDAHFEPSQNVTPPVCGDQVCDELETCGACAQDCCRNDKCSTPIVVEFAPAADPSISYLFFRNQGSSQGATLDSQILNTRCATTPLGPDVWFLLNPTEEGFVAISTCSGSTYDTTLAIFLLNSTTPGNTTSDNTTTIPVDCSQLTELNCNNDAGSLSCATGNIKGSTLFQILEAGKQYMVRLAGAEVNSGRYEIEFQFFPGDFSADCGDSVCENLFETCSSCPQDCCPNDLCTNATLVSFTPTNLTSEFFGNILNATLDVNIPSTPTGQFCSLPGPDAWFRFEPTSSGILTVSTCSNRTNFDTALALFLVEEGPQNATNTTSAPNNTLSFESMCGQLTMLACNDDFNCSSNPAASQISANVSEGASYLIRVSGFSESFIGWYEVAFSFEGAPNATGGTGTPATSSGGGPETVEVRGRDFEFIPESVTIKAGDSVHWSWTGTHNVAETTTASSLAAKQGGFRSGPCCATNSEYTRIFDTPGTYHYLCEAHAALGMRGTVIVEE